MSCFLHAKFAYPKDAWDSLAPLYVQTNAGKRYPLERKFRNAQQGNDSIHPFYVKMTNLWDQLSFLERQFTSAADSATFEINHQETRLVQFLTALRPEYELVRSMHLHWSPLPSVDITLSELLPEEYTQSSPTRYRGGPPCYKGHAGCVGLTRIRCGMK